MKLKDACCLEIKAMTNIGSKLKSRKNILLTKVPIAKAMAIMYRCESWNTKKSERQKIDAFELWCWKDS